MHRVASLEIRGSISTLPHTPSWRAHGQIYYSDHRLLTFNLGMVTQDRLIDNTDFVGLRYAIRNEDYGRFEAILSSNMMITFNCEINKESFEKKKQVQSTTVLLKMYNTSATATSCNVTVLRAQA